MNIKTLRKLSDVHYNKKVVGQIMEAEFEEGKKVDVYVTERNRHHVMRNLFAGSVGVSQGVLEHLKKNHAVKFILLKYRNVDGLSEWYWTSVSQWEESDKVFEYKGDLQRFLGFDVLKLNQASFAYFKDAREVKNG